MNPWRCLVFFSAITLVPTGEALSCYVCTPSLVGDITSKELANKIDTNITRNHDGALGPCSEFDPTAEIYQKPCKFKEVNSVCAKITHGAWVALSCYWVPSDSGMVCENQKDGTHMCQCDGMFCNTKPNSAPATTNYNFLLLATTAIFLFH